MTAIAQRLDPCVNWFKLVARTKGRILWIFPGLLLFVYLVAVAKNGNIFAGSAALRQQRVANAPLLVEARRLALDYDKVLSDPAAAVGKPVVWCVSSNDGEHGLVETVAGRPVVWTDPAETLLTNNGTHGYCLNELAVVVGVDRGIVRLRPIEAP